MKYGETLRQRSIPAWNHYNIDYDDIKHFIKEQTTPGQGKSVSVPGRGDDKLIEFENALFHILQEQHSRIDLFVKSKAGEIRRRVDHAKRHLKQLLARDITGTDKKIPIRLLEKYSRLETDVLKAGDEIKSLARFGGTQRTAFRKLLKKYKKWTGSPDLETRFREEVLDDPKSFTKLDLGPLLDDYSETLQSIRSLYETRLQQTGSPTQTSKSLTNSSTLPIEQIQSSLASKTKVDFDTAIATIPLGEHGSLAHYFVHVDNVVELQVLLLQHLEHYIPRSRSDSGVPSQLDTDNRNAAYCADNFTLVADNLDRFARDESGVTVDEREHLPGLIPQRARVCVRWNTDEDAVVSAHLGAYKLRSASLKKKHVDTFFDKGVPITNRKGAGSANDAQNITAIRDELLKDATIRPLYSVSSNRSRFIGLGNGSSGGLFATLDANITMKRDGEDSGFDFPYAVLHVRQEGNAGTELLSMLDCSHLVERVRGFSLQYHALWQVCKASDIAAPFWIPILSRDIRKLPPPATKAESCSAAGSSGSQSATRRSASTAGGTTAVETAGHSSSAVPDQLETPPLRSFRKKRRRTYARESLQSRQKYWSEYDHPEEAEGDAEAYVLYINPDEKSILDRMLERLGSMFGERLSETEPLLHDSATPEEDEMSSDDEPAMVKPALYGTLPLSSTSIFPSSHPSRQHRAQHFPLITGICLVASLAILIVAYILAETSKHKFATEVDAGVLFAIGCSLAFAFVGFIPLLTRGGGSWLAFGVAATVLLIDAVCAGWLTRVDARVSAQAVLCRLPRLAERTAMDNGKYMPSYNL